MQRLYLTGIFNKGTVKLCEHSLTGYDDMINMISMQT